MEYMTDLTAAYVPLSLVPQPLKHSKPGQLRLKPSKSVAKLKGRSEATTISAELCIVNPELIATKRLLQERYGLEPDGHELTAADDEDAATTAQQPLHLLQRKLSLQQLEKHKLRAAAVRSTAEAVQEWFKWGGPAICPAADALSAKALLVLNAEAEKGLLHLISTGLMPEEMDLTPGLCGGPHSPLTFKHTQLHPSEAKQAAASSTLAQSAVVSSPRPVTLAVKKPPAHSASWSPSDQQQSMALQSHASLSAPVRPQPAQLPHAAVADAEPCVGRAASAAGPQPRAYEALLDDLSEHQLLIHMGKLVQDTPQVLSFIRVAVPLWSTVSVLLSQLEALCRVFNVQLAVIDGIEVLQLAQTLIACSSSSSSSNNNSSQSDVEKQMPRSKPAAELSDLLCCIANLDELEHLFSSVSGEMAAAALHSVDNPVNTAETVISQCSRVIVSEPDPGTVGSEIKQPATDVSSANAPQAAGQSTTVVATTGVAVEKSATVRVPAKVFKAAEGTLLDTMYQARHERDAVFQQLQHSLRHHWPQIKQQPHVVLHLPSIPAKQHQLHQLHDTSISQQQHQLWRVLDVATDHTCHASEAESDGSSQAAQPQQAEHNPSSQQSQRTLQAGDSCRTCVVLVTSQPVNKQLQSHWYQLLRIAGESEPSSSVRFVSTAPADEADAPGPSLATLPLSARLMASHKALDRCKHIITGVSSIRSASQPAAAAAAAGVRPQQPQLVCDREVLHVQKLEGSKHISSDVDKAIDHVSRDSFNSTKSVPAGYIVPGCPNEHDCDVAVKLGLPILGPTPQLAHVLSSRIGARSLFAAAGIRLPPGGVLPRTSHISMSPNSSNSSSAADLADWQQLLSGMCMQLLRYPQQAQWMIKLNVGLHGARGLAVLDLAAMQATQSALASAIQVLKATGEQQPQPHKQQQTPQVELLPATSLSTVPADQLQAALQQMVPALASELHLGLQLLQPAYWLQQAVGTNAVSDAAIDEQLSEAAVEAYLLELLRLGGTMESFLSDIVCCPLVQLLLEPDGHITVIATQDKIMHEGCSSPGSLFPSGCPAHAALVQAATAAGEAAMAAGMLGYLQVAFICTRASNLHMDQAAEHEFNSRYATACSAHASQEPDGNCAEGQNQQQQQMPRCSIGGRERTVTSSVLLWGCDLLPWPSPDLAMFRLFHAVKQGQFDSSTGQYVVLKDAAEHQQQQQQDEEEQENVGPQQGWQPQHCSYACLHNPAAVIPPQQLTVVAQKGLLAPAADMTSHHAKRGNYGQTMQPLLSQTVLHSFGTSGEVIVSMDASRSSGCQCVDHSTCTDCLSERGLFTGGICTGNGGKTAAPSSREEQHLAADIDVSGIVCCSTGYEAVGALSCLSGLISNLANALQE